jgi:hypothetical protein
MRDAVQMKQSAELQLRRLLTRDMKQKQSVQCSSLSSQITDTSVYVTVSSMSNQSIRTGGVTYMYTAININMKGLYGSLGMIFHLENNRYHYSISLWIPLGQ